MLVFAPMSMSYFHARYMSYAYLFLAYDGWFAEYRGSVDPSCCALVFKCKTKVCTLLGGARLYFVILACNNLNYPILCANPCVVIKHQKGGD